MPDNVSLFEKQPVVTDGVQNTLPVENDIIDLDLSVTKKKKFRIDGDNSRIIELNVSDMNILARMSDTYPKLNALQDKASKLMDGISFDDDADDEQLTQNMQTAAERLKSVDTEMRELIDFMFDADVSSKAAPDGSMYDPFKGSPRYEYIITLLMKQYETNLQSEYAEMEKQLSKHTAKYQNRK
jgi:hypothetical protein